VGTGHEELLINAIKELQKQGFRIIRLDRRAVPDAIAIKEQEVVAVEADANPTSIWLTKKKFENGTSQYDGEIVVTKPYSEHYHTSGEYVLALQLRSEGRSYREIQRILKEKTGRPIPTSLLHYWIKGRSKPLTV